MGMDIKMWDNDRRNLKLDQAKLIDIDSLGRDSAFDVAVQLVRNGSNSSFVYLAKPWTKRWPTVSKLEILDLPCFNVWEGIQRLTMTGMLK